MKYFPLRDPLTDVTISGAGRNHIVVTLYIDGEPRGQIRVKHAELSDFLNLVAEPVPVAEFNQLFDSGTEWFKEYSKSHVISEDGVIVHKDDVP